MRPFTEVAQALQVILHLTTSPGDAIAIHTPAYPPWLGMLADMWERIAPCNGF